MKINISVPGKVILIGEHSVVFGKPALVAAIERRIKIKLSIINDQLSIGGKSEIPVGIGMGSSAALAVCQITAVSEIFNLNLNLEEINNFAYELEKERHGNPSGIDNTICTFGGLLWYQKVSDFLKIFHKIQITNNIKHLTDKFLLINTGKPKETTKELVENVRKLYTRRPKYVEKILNNQEIQTKKMLMGLVGGKDESLMREAVRLSERNLERLGVVSELTKELIRDLEKLGAVAKISGAGGKKDKSGLVLVYTTNKKPILEFCQKLNLRTLDLKIAKEGLTIEQFNNQAIKII